VEKVEEVEVEKVGEVVEKEEEVVVEKVLKEESNILLDDIRNMELSVLNLD
jgi:hypothetical protein